MLWFLSPRVHVRERALPARWGHKESEVLLAVPVTAAHRFPCFAFCLKKKRCFTRVNSHWVSHRVTACLSVYLRTFTFPHVKGIYISFFPPKLCTSMLFFEREPAGKNISVQQWSEWQVPRAWCMLNSRWCTLYLPATFCALYTWFILYRWQHFWTYLGTVALGAAPHSCIYTCIFRLCRLGWFVGSAVVPRVPPVPSAQQQKVDWRARGQHLGVDEQKINLRKVH